DVRLHKILSRVGLRHVDFLKYSGEVEEADATVLYARPCAFRAFRDIHVPKLLGIERNIKKISHDCAGQLREYFMQSDGVQL
ncbi:MAG: hypothetical protein K2K07_00955, partial [Lachnospiraceae bacterium]|nr:hypothetical protein [Lachnospiraceae bacterium]